MEWSFSRDTSSKFQSKTEIFHVMSPLNEISSSRNSRNPSIGSWDEVTPHWSDGVNVRSEFPVKDTFSIGIQTIHKCTPEKGNQYHNMMIKNKHTQTICGYRLFMKSASQQTLPIPCTCVNSKKKKKDKITESGMSYMVSVFLHFLYHNAYTHESTSNFYFKKFRNNVILQWESDKASDKANYVNGLV